MKFALPVRVMATSSLAVLLLLALKVNAIAQTYATRPLPMLTRDADAICIGIIIGPTPNGQQIPRRRNANFYITVRVAGVLKGVITNPTIIVRIPPEVDVDTCPSTALFLLNGKSDDTYWDLTPSYFPLLPLEEGSKAPDPLTKPLFNVITVLCNALPRLDKQDRFNILLWLPDIVPLLDPHYKDSVFVRESLDLGGYSSVQNFAKVTIFPAIEPFYSDADADTRYAFLSLGKKIGDIQANAPLAQTNK